jgi:hypothetical protein
MIQGGFDAAMSEFQAQLPGWRLTSAVTDGTFAQATTGVDVSSGGPGSTWRLQPLADPADLVVIVPPKPAVSGGCVVSKPTDNPDLPVALTWNVEVVGLDQITSPTTFVLVSYGAGASTSTKGVPIDLTKSWQQVFGKSLKVTAKGGQQAGPDRP